MRWILAGLGLKRHLAPGEALDLLSPMADSLLGLKHEYRTLAEMNWVTQSTGKIPSYKPLDWEKLRTTDLSALESVYIRVPVPLVGGDPERMVKEGAPYGKVLLSLSNGMDGKSFGRVGIWLYTDDWDKVDIEAAADGLLKVLDTAAATRFTGNGFITWDTAVGIAGSPYEFATAISPFYVDWCEYVFGYYWANLLLPAQLDVLRRRGTPPSGSTILDRGDWGWLRLDSPITRCSADEMRQIRDYLEPLLPPGTRTVEEYLEWRDNAGPPDVPMDFHLL